MPSPPTFWEIEIEKDDPDLLEHVLRSPKDHLDIGELAEPLASAPADTSGSWLVQQASLIDTIIADELQSLPFFLHDVDDIVECVEEYCQEEPVTDYLPEKWAKLGQAIANKYILPSGKNLRTIEALIDALASNIAERAVDASTRPTDPEDEYGLVSSVESVPDRLTYYYLPSFNLSSSVSVMSPGKGWKERHWQEVDALIEKKIAFYHDMLRSRYGLPYQHFSLQTRWSQDEEALLPLLDKHYDELLGQAKHQSWIVGNLVIFVYSFQLDNHYPFEVNLGGLERVAYDDMLKTLKKVGVDLSSPSAST